MQKRKKSNIIFFPCIQIYLGVLLSHVRVLRLLGHRRHVEERNSHFFNFGAIFLFVWGPFWAHFILGPFGPISPPSACTQGLWTPGAEGHPESFIWEVCGPSGRGSLG